MIFKLFSSLTVRTLCFSFIAFGTPLYLVHSFLWTEPFFITVLCVHLFFLGKYLNTGARKYIIVCTIASLLLLLTRHAGIFLVVGTVLALVLVANSKSNYMIAGIYGFCSGSLFITWNIYKSEGLEKRYSDLLAPVKEDRYAIYQDNILNYLDQLPHWVFPPFLPYFVKVVFFFIFLFLLIWVFWKYKAGNDQPKFFSVMAIIFVVYYTCIHTMYTVNPADIERYLSPVFVIFGIIMFKAVELCLPLLKMKISKKYVYALLVLLFLVYPIFRTMKNVLHFYQLSCSY